jgi:hypothetical protein
MTSLNFETLLPTKRNNYVSKKIRVTASYLAMSSDTHAGRWETDVFGYGFWTECEDDESQIH